jgi:lysophospholipase L1-like esterase
MLTVQRMLSVTPKLQVVASKGAIPIQLAGAAANNYTRPESRLMAQSPRIGVRDLRLLYSNFYANGTTGEADVPNGITIEAAVELTSPAAKTLMATFGGAATGALVAGAPYLVSDVVLSDLPALTAFFVRSGALVTSGQRWGTGGKRANNNDSMVESTSASSQVSATGTMSTPSGGAAVASSNAFGPTAILGIPSSPLPSCVIVGDSIAYGQGDGYDNNGNSGFAERGLYGANIPWINLSRSSDRAMWMVRANYPQRRKLWQYCNLLLCALGSNDIANGHTVSAIQASLLEIWADAHARGMNVVQATITTRTTSSDNWATKANQSYVTGFEPGGKADQLNAWIKQQAADGVIEGVIDIATAIADPTDLNKWLTNGAGSYATFDGTHPLTALHVLAANSVTSFFNTVFLPKHYPFY